jgi:hypothetical protein
VAGIVRVWHSIGLIGLTAGLISLGFSFRPNNQPPRLTSGAPQVPLRSGLAPDDKLTVQIDDTDLSKCLALYAELTGRELWPGRKSALQRFDEALGYKLSRWGWIKPFFAPSTGIIYHRDGRFRADEVKEQLERVLRSAGLVPIPQGRDYFVLGSS